MRTDCIPAPLTFEGLCRRSVVGAFDGGHLTADGGVLLREVGRRFRVTARLAPSWPVRVCLSYLYHAFPLHAPPAGEISGLAAGYEDLNDHDLLRADSAFALASGCADVTGEGRRRARDRGHALVGSSTLNRLELGVPEGAADRYKRIAAGGDRARSRRHRRSAARPPRRAGTSTATTGTTAISRCTRLLRNRWRGLALNAPA